MECAKCGGGFTPIKKWQKFCSRGCQLQYWKDRRDLARKLLEEHDAKVGS